MQVDTNVTRHLDEELNIRKDWDILILHYLGLDHIGHVMGPSSPLIESKLKEMDSVVKQIYLTFEKKVCFTKESYCATTVMLFECSRGFQCVAINFFTNKLMYVATITIFSIVSFYFRKWLCLVKLQVCQYLFDRCWLQTSWKIMIISGDPIPTVIATILYSIFVLLCTKCILLGALGLAPCYCCGSPLCFTENEEHQVIVQN